MTNPFDRLTSRVPDPWRSVLDWGLSIAFAVVVVLAVKVEVANPYRVPSSSMEPTLHCARPGAGCQSSHSDRVVANRFIYASATRDEAKSSSSTRRRRRSRPAKRAARS